MNLGGLLYKFKSLVGNIKINLIVQDNYQQTNKDRMILIHLTHKNT